MPRHSEPDYVVKWREAVANPPKCCHTCDEYDAHGRCMKHWATPPADFAEKQGVCNDWIAFLPF
jgi:hypothetical protein